MARRFNTGYYLSEGFQSIFTHGFMSFAAVCMIVACLLIMGSFTLLAVNLNNMLGDLENENEMVAYVEEDYTREQALALQKDLAQVPNVSQLEFVTRQTALDQFRAGRQNNPLLSDLTAWVNAATAVAQGFVLVRNIATGVAMVLVGILLVVSLFIIANTIKLATFYRREEIAIMKMCGATDGFIEWPFVVEGMLLGLSGALIAFFAQWGLYQLVAKLAIQGNGLSLVTLVSYTSMAPTILGVFCAIGAVIGVGGSLLAIRKFLQV